MAAVPQECIRRHAQFVLVVVEVGVMALASWRAAYQQLWQRAVFHLHHLSCRVEEGDARWKDQWYLYGMAVVQVAPLLPLAAGQQA